MNLEKYGKKIYAVPLVIIILFTCLLSLIFAPMLQATPKHVPFAIVSLDEGGTTIAGSANIGDTMIETLTEGDGLGAIGEDDGNVDTEMSDAISWTVLDSEEEARQALANNEYYGAIIIPKNFTSAQMSSMVGLGSAPEITVLLNEGKNATLSNSMQMTLSQAMLKAGVGLDVETVNSADIGGGMMAGMMAAQMMIMPLFLMSLIPSILVSFLLWPRGENIDRKKKGKKLFVQLAYIAGLSLVVSLCVLLIGQVFGGLTLPVGSLLPFMWFASACIMLAIVGLCDLSLPLGAILAILVFGLGMSTVLLSPEILPDFWRDWVVPWIPQYHISQGFRTIIYFGTAPLLENIVPLLVMALVGVVAMVIGVMMSSKQAKTDSGVGPDSDSGAGSDFGTRSSGVGLSRFKKAKEPAQEPSL